jgi:hypothetical protein
MTTARDLLTVTMDMPSTQPVERGDLSLALAGAEAVDLLRLGAVTLTHDRLVPDQAGPVADRLLGEAASSLVRQAPYETVEDWLWRRGRGLPTAYLAAFEDEGQLTRQRQRRWLVFHASRMVLADSAGRRRAAHRWAADEPVLAALATTIGVSEQQTGAPDGSPVPDVPDDAVAAVLAAVVDAVAELAGERHRRSHRRDEARANTLRRGY